MSHNHVKITLVDFSQSPEYSLMKQFMMDTQDDRVSYLRARTNALRLGGYHLHTFYVLMGTEENDDFRKKLLDDEEVMSKYVDFNGFLYFKASERLRNEQSFIKRAVQQNGMLFLALDEQHQTRDNLMTAVKEDGLALKAAINFDLDLEICEQAVKTNGMSFDYMSTDTTNNDIINMAFDDNPIDSRRSYLITDKQIGNKVALYCGLLPDGRSNISKEIIREVLKMDPFSQQALQGYNLSQDEIFDLTKTALQYSGDVGDYFNLYNFTIEQGEELVKYEGNVLGFIEEEDQTREMILEAVKNSGESLRFANKELVDEEIVLEAIKQDPQAIQFTSYDRNFILDRVKENGEILAYIKDEEQFADDREIIMNAVSNYGMALGYASGELQDDEEIVKIAVSNCGLALEFADDKLRGRSDIILLAVSENGLALQFSYNQNDEIVNTALNQSFFAFAYVAPFMVTKELALMALKRYPHFFTHDNLLPFRQDREVTLCAVERCGRNLEHVADQFKSDPEIVMAAVSNFGFAIQYADEELQDDYDIVKAAIMNNPFSLDYASDRLKLDLSLLRLFKELQDAEVEIVNSWEEEFDSILKRCREDYMSESDDEEDMNHSKTKKIKILDHVE